ncbi:serine/threonine-protein kinase [Paracoccus litorisediminis]|uniref:serine/threonine-protein kinase n=1 Tax=Paracoccus litorisediminis TaxID=2006130 RepID=UPI00372EAB37
MGGMSVAVLCEDVRLGRNVMLKIVQAPKFKSRLVDEINSLLAIRSKNVVQILDLAQLEVAGDWVDCIVLEHIQGKELLEGSFTCDRNFAGLLLQIASGLREIHETGIVHRDIKPNNIMLDDRGVVKIIDFGLAREIDKNNHTNSAVGHLPYMAPELLSPPVTFSQKADVYSFGVLALGLMTSRIPQFCTTLPRSYPFPRAPIISAFSNFHDALREHLYRCFSENPEDRPTMTVIQSLLAKEYWKGLRKASVSLPSGSVTVSAANRKATPSIRSKSTNTVVSSLVIEYDDIDFIVTAITGGVLANNIPLVAGSRMPDACVLSFPSATPSRRFFATWDVSNPELIV